MCTHSASQFLPYCDCKGTRNRFSRSNRGVSWNFNSGFVVFLMGKGEKSRILRWSEEQGNPKFYPNLGLSGVVIGASMLITVDGRNPFCSTLKPWLKPTRLLVLKGSHYQKPGFPNGGGEKRILSVHSKMTLFGRESFKLPFASSPPKTRTL